MIAEVTDEDFAEVVLRSERPVLVDYWRPSCGPCRMLAVVLDDLAASQDGVQIVKVNAEENPTSIAAFNVSSVPTLQLFNRGAMVKSLVGAKPRSALIAEFGEYFGAGVR